MVLLLCFLIGVVAGLRTMTALAATSWAAYASRLPLGETWLAFLGYRWTPWIATALAALLEDAVAVGVAALIVVALP